MADLIRRERRRHETARRVLTASASVMTPNRSRSMVNPAAEEWQRQVWHFYEALGSFKYGVLWHSQVMSRVRLVAARAPYTGDEPEILTDGPVYDAVKSFFNGPLGQRDYMTRMDQLYQTVGEGYVTAHDRPDGTRAWAVRSAEELRPSSMSVSTVDSSGRPQRTQLWEVLVDEGVWQQLPPESLVFRQWNPDARFSFRPDSAAKSAITDMRIIELMLNRVMAQAVSRLASNGVLFYPQEVTFPARPGQPLDEDPLTATLIDIATRSIDNPGSAAAAVPMPWKVPAEFIDKFVHMDFANPFDEHLLPILQQLYDRMATDLNMPKEVIEGTGKTSHWNSWSIDEAAKELHVKPACEELCSGVTRAYLHPYLETIGEPVRDDVGEFIFWYDANQLDAPPDLSAAADQARDRHAISDAAYRTAKGFAETDKPNNTELRTQLLIDMAKDPASAPAAIEELTGSPVAGATPVPTAGDTVTPPATGSPGPQEGAPPEPPADSGEPVGGGVGGAPAPAG